MNKITYEIVRELFDYDPETGKLTWKVRRQGVRFGHEAGNIDVSGYRRVRINRKAYYVHRIIWLWMYGAWPEEMIDHINGIPDDNRWENLREASHSENLMNRRAQSNNNSGHKNIYKHVTKEIRHGKTYLYEYWRVAIVTNGKTHSKCFPYTDAGLDQAIIWRDKMLPILHQEFAFVD